MPKNAEDPDPNHLGILLGRRIRARRRSLGQPQQQLAEALGITFQQVQRYERGASRVSSSRLVDLARALRCSVADLTEGLDPEPPHEGVQTRTLR